MSTEKQRIEKITAEICDSFRDDFNAAMVPLSEKYGAKVKLGNITYGEMDFCARVTVELTAVPDSNGNVMDADARTFKRHASLYGLKPEWLFTTFRAKCSDGTDAEEIRIVGMRLKKGRGRTWVMCKRLNTGQSWRFTPMSVFAAITPAPAVAKAAQS